MLGRCVKSEVESSEAHTDTTGVIDATLLDVKSSTAVTTSDDVQVPYRNEGAEKGGAREWLWRGPVVTRSVQRPRYVR